MRRTPGPVFGGLSQTSDFRKGEGGLGVGGWGRVLEEGSAPKGRTRNGGGVQPYCRDTPQAITEGGGATTL
jgi:hypothetical protein